MKVHLLKRVGGKRGILTGIIVGSGRGIDDIAPSVAGGENFFSLRRYCVHKL